VALHLDFDDDEGFAAYNDDVIGNMQPWALGSFIIPDVTQSYIKS